ncbi:uncharacterized protein LOC107044087 [Diachasma alloeum]|uniref:uncharacterized protein LOC107044087 n=1 Tax=Diachasma alloeum TaxID=454923 RepID=UPI00073826E8|nr:uncharacterized protein LOC107044087 [Diachasma alloeum]
MDPSRLSFRCIVCDTETSSLCALHNHQSTHHTSEELSLSILTLQSFLYHKHYFQSLDAKPPSEVCYFYPFCTQLFSSKGKNLEENFKTFCPSPPRQAEQLSLKRADSVSETIPAPQRARTKSPRKQMPLRLPLTAATRPTIIKSLNSLAKQRESSLTDAVSSPSDSHTAFISSANGLCDDLTKLKGSAGQSKIKRKRLNERKDRPRPAKRENKQKVQKPPRKPKIENVGRKVQTILPKISAPGDSRIETLNIWASKGEESVSLNTVNTLTGVTLAESVQPIKIQSPTVPVDIMNCENALIFDAETGSFQWNPLVFVEKKGEENGNAPQQGDVPVSALPNGPTGAPDNC